MVCVLVMQSGHTELQPITCNIVLGPAHPHGMLSRSFFRQSGTGHLIGSQFPGIIVLVTVGHAAGGGFVVVVGLGGSVVTPQVTPGGDERVVVVVVRRVVVVVVVRRVVVVVQPPWGRGVRNSTWQPPYGQTSSSQLYISVRTGTCGGQLQGLDTWLTKRQFSLAQRRAHADGRASLVMVGQARRASSARATAARNDSTARVFIVSRCGGDL